MRSQSQRTERYATMSVASSVPSHIVPRTKLAPSGPVRSRNLLVIKQALIYDTRPVLTYKESIFSRLQESVAHAEGKLNTAKANTKMINIKSDEIVKKSQKKFDFTNTDVKTRRFEQNMKAFEKLSTFINVRDVLQNMNTASQEKVKKGPKLPPLQILREDETEYVVSPVVPNTVSGSVVKGRPSFGFSTQRGLNVSSVEEAISLKRLSKGQIMHRRAKSTKNSVIQLKEDDLEEKVKRKDSYEMIMEKTTNFIANLNDVDNRAQIFENNGKDLFYKELQDNILHKKFEVKKNNLFAEKNKEMSEEQYYKGLLEFKEEAEAIDKKYYDNYKAKTEKVLEMLKRASKDIFNRVSTRKRPGFLGKNSKGNAEQEALETDIRDKWKQKLEQLLASDKFKGQYIGEELKYDLDAEFSEMMAKVNNIILIYEANQKRRDFVEEEEEEIEREKSPKTERLMANRLNHEINKHHKNYMRNIIESAENHETILRKTKDGFRKKMRKIEDGFDKDILRIFPKDFESLRSDPGWASLYVDRPIRRNFSRKALNAINH